jgi:hypothetical protein
LTAVRDSNITLAAPGTVEVDGATYAWQGWSDSGARVHTVLAHCSATYTALYEVGTAPNESETTQIDVPCAEPPEEERLREAGKKEGEPPKGESARLQTKLGKHPGKRSKSKTAKFTFSSTEPRSRFRCKLEHGRFRACRSPRTYVGLKPGKHVFRVYAIGPDGLADKSPAKFVWRVIRRP